MLSDPAFPRIPGICLSPENPGVPDFSAQEPPHSMIPSALESVKENPDSAPSKPEIGCYPGHLIFLNKLDLNFKWTQTIFGGPGKRGVSCFEIRNFWVSAILVKNEL